MKTLLLKSVFSNPLLEFSLVVGCFLKCLLMLVSFEPHASYKIDVKTNKKKSITKIESIYMAGKLNLSRGRNLEMTEGTNNNWVHEQEENIAIQLLRFTRKLSIRWLNMSLIPLCF